MDRPRILHVTSAGALRTARPTWDDLWWRSDLTLPSVRAELLALWLDHFAPQARFHALVVEDQGQWVAALPLIAKRVGRVIPAGGLPSNEWTSGGELLLDPDADVPTVLDALVDAVARLDWPLLWLENVAIDAPRWNALAAALQRAAVSTHLQPRFQVGLLAIDRDWETYRRSWSKNHRQRMNRCARRLAAAGDVHCEVLSHLQPGEVERWLRRGFEVEDRSWKGPAGTSVLRSPKAFAFLHRQAQLLAEYGQLELAFLESEGRPIAFQYSWNAKGVCHVVKIGYDAHYAAYTPGQLLQHDVLKRLYADPHRQACNFMGPLTDATSKWQPGSYTAGRVAIAPGLLGRSLLAAYKHTWPLVRRVTGRQAPRTQPPANPGQRVSQPQGEASSAPPVTSTSPSSTSPSSTSPSSTSPS